MLVRRLLPSCMLLPLLLVLLLLPPQGCLSLTLQRTLRGGKASSSSFYSLDNTPGGGGRSRHERSANVRIAFVN